MKRFPLAMYVAIVLFFGLAGARLAAAQDTGRIEGRVADSGGGVLPGVLVELLRAGAPRPLSSVTTTIDGAYRFDGVRPGSYVVRFALAGFSSAELPVTVAAAETVTVPVALQIQRLKETVQVVASEVKLDRTTSTQATTFSNQELNELPTASRNYTHVIVAEAGVNAPLPDRTGRGLNIATNPGTQGDDASQSLNPSVNGARPTNNNLRVNGIDVTNMLNGGGGLGNNVMIPLEALSGVDLQTALPTAARGRNGGGNTELNVRSGTDRFSGSAGAYVQHERWNANEFFLNRAGVAKPEFRRNDATVTLGGPVVPRRTFFFAAGQRQMFRSGRC